ncbi:hypothetical protein C7974DRAFT_443774 [Boeremia exigua]|uniref:uncharacterized protein n=1 Tax=Boeremia exigua TaxID=749465 RepID=UPI001E8E5EAC|nr:uncharacterized protein C7974DRAFT_443774 [Boeremia exigua]KAH6613901.1 hypothetical protein C7974DRAFT_443774 [Boeremia exigua]
MVQAISPAQHTCARKKIWPKRPSDGFRVRKRRTHITYNQRDHELTDNQRSWSRALTVSLSGWPARREFLSAQIAARKEETRTNVARTGKQIVDPGVRATTPVQRSRVDTGDKQHDVARKAWARKAALMHRAGSGAKQISAWDPVAETYLRDYELEKQMAAFKAAHEASSASDSASDSDSDSDTDADDEESGGSATPDASLGVVGPDTPPSSSPPAAFPEYSPVPLVDWRAKARAGIAKKKLSIGKGWSALTWNQKSNVHERLLLLEDDGVDVRELLERKLVSEEVTALVLERAAMQGTDGTAGLREASSMAGTGVGVLQTAMSPVLSGSSSLATQLQGGRPAGPPWHLTDAPVVEDTTQLFSLLEPYRPRASSRLKRKRSDATDQADRDDALTDSPPARKKRNIPLLSDEALASQALQALKHAVLRRVFRAAQCTYQKHAPPTTITLTPTALPRSLSDSNPTVSSPTDRQSRDPQPAVEARTWTVPRRGLAAILRELRFLACIPTDADDDADADTSTIALYNPDYNPDYHDTSPFTSPPTAETLIKTRLSLTHQQRSRIIISPSPASDGAVLLHGPALALAELFRVLQGGVLHCAAWEWDGVGLRSGGGGGGSGSGRESGWEWELGGETRGVLWAVEQRLREGG